MYFGRRNPLLTPKNRGIFRGILTHFWARFWTGLMPIWGDFGLKNGSKIGPFLDPFLTHF